MNVTSSHADVVRRNYESILTRIRVACSRRGRDPTTVRLVAVTKTVRAEQVRILYDLGHRDFGENRVQELERKAEALADLPGVVWHLIGHLQRNKVRKVLPLCGLIHSVDSLQLADEIADRSVQLSRRTPVLLEVNVSGEGAKFGLKPEEAGPLVESLAGRPGVRIDGLMTMAPFTEDMELCRSIFRELARLRDGLKSRFASESAPLAELSMGMTQDFEVAVEEGATLVRVGTALFQGLP